MKNVIMIALLTVLHFSIMAFALAQENLPVLSSGKGETHCYRKDTIISVDKNIKEVIDETATTESNIIRTLRFDCSTSKYSIGQTYGYTYGNLVSSMNLSSNGWVWFDITPNDIDEKKLLTILCAKPKKKK